MKTKKQIDSLAQKELETLPEGFAYRVWKDAGWCVEWSCGNVLIEYVEDLEKPFRIHFDVMDFSVLSSGDSAAEALGALTSAVLGELIKKSAVIREIGSFFKGMERQCLLKSVTAKCRSKSARRRTN